jgi:crossover junction endodeoxyribonuclease RusA
MSAVRLVLPYPISANAYWRSFVPRGHSRAVVTLSEEAKVYKAEVGWISRQAGVRAPLDCRCSVHVQLYPARPQDWAKRAAKNPLTWDDDVRSIDIDNANKVLLDALKGIAIVDDSRRYVRRLLGEQMEPDALPARVVVTIEPLALPMSSQLDLLGASA